MISSSETKGAIFFAASRLPVSPCYRNRSERNSKQDLAARDVGSPEFQFFREWPEQQLAWSFGEPSFPNRSFRIEFHQSRCRRRADTAFSDEAGDKLCRSDVKCVIASGGILWGDAHFAAFPWANSANHVSDLAVIPLFDWDFGDSILDRPINCGFGKSYVKWHLMRARCQRLEIGADLICYVAGRRDTVGTHDDDIHQAALNQMSRSIVSDDRQRDASLTEFPGGQRRALVPG